MADCAIDLTAQGTETLAPCDSDLALVVRMGEGDASAMAALYDRHSRLVYSIALRVLRDQAASEDVLQDVFFGMWRKPVSFDGSRGSFASWVGVVTRNRAIDVLRRRRPEDTIDDVPLVARGDVHEEVERVVMIERARLLIAKLPEVQQMLLSMAFFEGKSHVEIAESTGTPLGTIKCRLRTALKGLRVALQA